MRVTSPPYFIFVAVLWLLVLHVRSPKGRQALLLVSSYVFYATWGVAFLALLIASSVMNYRLGTFLRRRPTATRLWISVSANLVLLVVFKYLPILATLAPTDSSFARELNRIIMPVGISFWTFQALSYLFDVYREEKLEPSRMEFCLYMAFWPTVLSGPVCRLPNLLPQFRNAPTVSWEEVEAGILRILTGLFMKLILAQWLVDGIVSGEGVIGGFSRAGGGWGGIDVWFLAVGYGFLLYFDFGGYSNIVIGVARIFGYRLEENFDHPYFSTTPSVFWTHWHMSLSSWIRDYLFLPMAAVRRGYWWRNMTLIFSMIVFGIWHEGSLLFLIWGTYQGLLLVLHRQLQQVRRRFSINWPAWLETPLSWGLTFSSISLGWVFFRSHDVKSAFLMLSAVTSPSSYHQLTLGRSLYWLIPLMVGGYFAFSGADSWLSQRYGVDRQARGGVDGEWVAFLWQCRLWWMIPMAMAIFLFQLLLYFAQGSPAAPFIYTGF